MPSFQTSTAAASATVGTDLFANEPFARNPQNRVINEFGLTGSAAAGDSEVDLYIDEVRIGNFFNSATGFPQFDTMVNMGRLFVPSGAQLRCIVRDAPATNPINTRVDMSDV